MTELEYSDVELIKAFCSGDEQAFNCLYKRYRRQLYGFLCNLIQSQNGDIDEIFEETWLRVIDRLSSYRDDGKFSAWLFRIARNLFIDRLRRNKPEQFVPIDADDAINVIAPAGFQADADLDNRELFYTIENALSKLPLEQREVFLLREQDFSFKEIAKIQNCSLNTALSRMRYATHNLRAAISKIDFGGVIK